MKEVIAIKRYNVMGYQMLKVNEVVEVLRRLRKQCAKHGKKDAVDAINEFVSELYSDEMLNAEKDEELEKILDMPGTFVVKNEDGAYVKIVADSPDMRHVEFVDGLYEATKFDYEVDANRVAIAVNSYSVHTWEVEELVSEGEQAIRQMIKALEERGGSNEH